MQWAINSLSHSTSRLVGRVWKHTRLYRAGFLHFKLNRIITTTIVPPRPRYFNMLRFVVLTASLASVSLGSVINFCVENPYREMQHFRDFGPAMSQCASHYPALTITKTLPNTCLTTTKTVITGTSTIHATNHMPCPTEHLEIRDAEEDLEERDLEERDTRGRTKKSKTPVRTKQLPSDKTKTKSNTKKTTTFVSRTSRNFNVYKTNSTHL